MKSIATFIFTLAIATSGIAGSPSYSGKSAKNVMQPAPPAPQDDCFAPGFSMGLFGGGMFPQHGGDDVAGGGVLAEYFFTRNIGFQTS